MTNKTFGGILALIALVVAVGWYAASRGVSPTLQPGADGAESSPVIDTDDEEEATVRQAVVDFGARLKNVSILAPSSADLSATLIREYGSYVAPELLAAWKADPSRALGRETSSPYPARILVSNIVRQDDGSYVVNGTVAETTTADQSVTVSSYPISLRLEKHQDSWLIVSASKL